MADTNKDDNVLDLLDSLDTKPLQKPKPKKASARKKEAQREAGQKDGGKKKASGDDILGFLDELKLNNNGKDRSEAGENQDALRHTNAGNDNRTSAEEAREPQATSEENKDITAEGDTTVIDPMASISSWWSRNKGGLWGAATGAANRAQDALQDAVQQARQAEARVREEQPHFSLNMLQSRLTSVLNTIVPPIGRHEQLEIHVFHDMVGYPSIDNLLYEVFDYVMDQVEGGGDLNLVVQKGKERHRAGSDYDVHRSLNYARCTLQDGVKLAKANVEEVQRSTRSASEGSQGEKDAVVKEADKTSNIHVSEIFISIQPVLTPGDRNELIAPSTESLYFVVYLTDLEHEIEISTASQAFPSEWAQWLESDNSEIRDAAIDPREWVSGWLEDGLNLAFGVLAQKYVTTRMGITK